MTVRHLRPALAALLTTLLAACTSWASIPLQPSVQPRAQLWTSGRATEVRHLSIGTDSMRAWSARKDSALLVLPRTEIDSVRVRRFDASKTVLTLAGAGAAAITVIGMSLQYGW